MIKLQTVDELVALVIRLREEGATEVTVMPDQVVVKMGPRPAAPLPPGKAMSTAAYPTPRDFKEVLPGERIALAEKTAEERQRAEDDILFNTDMSGTPL